MGKRGQFINNEKQIKVIEQVPLARDKAVFLIKYRDNEYIIATTPQNIEIIDKIKSEEMDSMAIKSKKLFLYIGIFLFFIFSLDIGYSENLTSNIPDISLQINGSENPRDLSNSIEMLMLFTVLTLLPSILIMMTSFTRVIVILSFLKNAMGVQQAIPSQVIVGLSLF